MKEERLPRGKKRTVNSLFEGSPWQQMCLSAIFLNIHFIYNQQSELSHDDLLLPLQIKSINAANQSETACFVYLFCFNPSQLRFFCLLLLDKCGLSISSCLCFASQLVQSHSSMFGCKNTGMLYTFETLLKQCGG